MTSVEQFKKYANAGSGLTGNVIKQCIGCYETSTCATGKRKKYLQTSQNDTTRSSAIAAIELFDADPRLHALADGIPLQRFLSEQSLHISNESIPI